MSTEEMTCIADASADETLRGASPFDALTTRQLEVARLLCIGRTTRQVADTLQISVKTADTHRAHVMRKLKTRNNVELLILALRSGFVALGFVTPPVGSST